MARLVEVSSNSKRHLRTDEKKGRECICNELEAVCDCYILRTDLKQEIWVSRGAFNLPTRGRWRNFIKIQRFKNCLLSCILHNVSTTRITTTSHIRSTKDVSDTTAVVEENRDLRSGTESMVVREPVIQEWACVILSDGSGLFLLVLHWGWFIYADHHLRH